MAARGICVSALISRAVRLSPVSRPSLSFDRTRTRVVSRNNDALLLVRTPAQQRWHSNPSSNSKVYDFAQVKALSESPSADRILIDVREPSEYADGYIPSAINIPVKSQPDALFLPEEEFEDKFGFKKPSLEKEVVFYCKSGVRSSAAAQIALQSGYTNVAEYRGSWLDWAKNGGPSGK